MLLDEPGTSSSDPDDVLPEALSDQAVTRLGDVWVLGNHRLICADATSERSYAALLGSERAEMAFTDPPYNVAIGGHVTSRGRHREFVMASGEMSPAQFRGFLESVFRLMARFSLPASIQFTCMDWAHLREILVAGDAAFSELKNLITWVKPNAGMGSFYRSQHELILAWKSGKGRHINNFGLGESGRYRSNVWHYAGVNGFRRGRDEDLADHPTVKPTALVADAIRDCSHRGGLILDPFVGSGTTILAAERTGRAARAIEIDPLYCDVAIRRWQERTKRKAQLLGSSQPFDQVAEARNDASKTVTQRVRRRRAAHVE